MFANGHAIPVSIPGIAAVTAAMPVVGMPEPGGLNPKAAAAPAGVAPIARQSGYPVQRYRIRTERL
jgi:transposase